MSSDVIDTGTLDRNLFAVFRGGCQHSHGWSISPECAIHTQLDFSGFLSRRTDFVCEYGTLRFLHVFEYVLTVVLEEDRSA